MSPRGQSRVRRTGSWQGSKIGQRLFIDLAELHLVRTAPCLIPAQVDVMHDPIPLYRLVLKLVGEVSSNDIRDLIDDVYARGVPG